MNKLSKDKRDKLIMTGIAVVASIAILYVFVLGAQKDKLATLSSKVMAAQDKLNKAERLVRSKDALDIKLAQNRLEMEKREEDMAPSGQYYYWFLKLLEEFRKQEGLENSFVVDITQPEFGEADLLPQFPYKTAKFTVRLNGHFQEVGRFLADFENKYPYFRVENIHIQPEAQGLGAIVPSKPGVSSAAPVSSGPNEKLVIQLRIVTLIKSATT
jgi:hypothetical protein